MRQVPFKKFTPEEQETWGTIFGTQAEKRDQQIHPMFSAGIRRLELVAEQVPDIDAVNRHLRKLTGFEGIPVEGLEEDPSFYPMLAERKFPIGNFIRHRKDLSYTPAPDIVHDLYGHLPFLADPDYADFCADLGRRAARYLYQPEVLKQFARLFWFTIEFGLVVTPQGKRIFGAGIASSIGECDYALSGKPEVLPFEIDTVRNQDFKIDEYQKRLFLIENLRDFYSCLPEFERRAAAG